MTTEIPDYLLSGYETEEGYVTPGNITCGRCHQIITPKTTWYWSKEKMRWDHSTVENPCIDAYDEKDFGQVKGPSHAFVQGYSHHKDKPLDQCWATLTGLPCLLPKSAVIHRQAKRQDPRGLQS